MTILFLNLQLTRSDIRPHIKLTVSLVIAYGHFNLPWGLCDYVWVNTLTLSPLRALVKSKQLSWELSVLFLTCQKPPHNQQELTINKYSYTPTRIHHTLSNITAAHRKKHALVFNSIFHLTGLKPSSISMRIDYDQMFFVWAAVMHIDKFSEICVVHWL